MSEEHIVRLGKRADRWRGALLGTVVFVQTAAILVLAVMLVVQATRAREGRDLLNRVDQSTHILVDCTTPGHPCYQRGQAGQQKAIEQLNRIIVLASFCSKQPSNATVDQIETCVVKGLK